MKHPGNCIDFTELRNRELLAAYRAALAESSFIDINVISERMVNSPCSRFWVSEERAQRVVACLDAGLPVLEKMYPLKREMFREIYRRVGEMRRQQPGLPLSDVVFFVVNSPAPKFYLQPRCAMEIIYRIRRGHYNKKG